MDEPLRRLRAKIRGFIIDLEHGVSGLLGLLRMAGAQRRPLPGKLARFFFGVGARKSYVEQKVRRQLDEFGALPQARTPEPLLAGELPQSGEQAPERGNWRRRIRFGVVSELGHSPHPLFELERR
jgi:hypothetical protein